MGPLDSIVPWWAKETAPRLENCPPLGMGALLTGAPAPQCSSHVAGEGEDQLKMPPSSSNWAGWSNNPCAPICQDFSGSTDQEVLDITDQVYWVSMCWPPVNSPASGRKSIWLSYDRSWASIWLGQASGKDWHQPYPLPGARDTSMATHPHDLVPLSWATRGQGSQMTKRGLIREVVPIKGLMYLIQI